MLAIAPAVLGSTHVPGSMAEVIRATQSRSEEKRHACEERSLAQARARHGAAALSASAPSVLSSIAAAEAALAKAKAALRSGDTNPGLPKSIASLEASLATLRGGAKPSAKTNRYGEQQRLRALEQSIRADIRRGDALILAELDRAAEEKQRHDRTIRTCYGSPESRAEARKEIAMEAEARRKYLAWLEADCKAFAAKRAR